MRQFGEILRFAVAGGLNTIVTGVALSLLAGWLDPRLAYLLVYLGGITVASILVSRFVFRSPLTRSRALAFGLMYLIVFGVGLLTLQFALHQGLPRRLSGLVVLVTAPLSYLGSKRIFSSSSTPLNVSTEGAET